MIGWSTWSTDRLWHCSGHTSLQWDNVGIGKDSTLYSTVTLVVPISTILQCLEFANSTSAVCARHYAIDHRPQLARQWNKCVKHCPYEWVRNPDSSLPLTYYLLLLYRQWFRLNVERWATKVGLLSWTDISIGLHKPLHKNRARHWYRPV